jgi:hypothetical protein
MIFGKLWEDGWLQAAILVAAVAAAVAVAYTVRL